MSKFPIVPSVNLPQANSSDFADHATALETRPETLPDTSPDTLLETRQDLHRPQPTTPLDGQIEAAIDAAEFSPSQEQADADSVEINWLYRELSADLLKHVKGSSFLELLCLSYFLGADEHLSKQLSAQTRSSSLLMDRLLSRLGYAAPYPEKLENARRLLSNNSLLRQFFHDGQHALSCHLTQAMNLQSSLQQLVRQYAHYSLMDLNQFNATPYNPQSQQQFNPINIPRKQEKSRAWTYLMAISLFLLLSAGGSYLLLRVWFPEILSSLLK